jgi:tripartite-type tricarboxylate transporter receptor subunit TctC
LKHRYNILALTSGLCAVTLSGLFSPALAVAENYPNRAIKIVVPVPPGVLLDVIPRIIGEKLSSKWGVPVIIENRPGAAQHIGAAAVAKSDPDGYTLLAAPGGPLVISQHLQSKLDFDPQAFTPVTVMVKMPVAVVVGSKVPVSNLKELIAYAKANPNKLTYGSPGIGSTLHLATELFLQAADIKLTHVPYKGLAPATNDLIAGHIDMMLDLIGNAGPNVSEKRVKLLAVTTIARNPEFPDVPSVFEVLGEYSNVEWFAIVAPPKTPAAVAAKLSAAIAEILNMPDVASRLNAFSAVAVGSSPAETAAFLQGESERWRRLIEATGIRID